MCPLPAEHSQPLGQIADVDQLPLHAQSGHGVLQLAADAGEKALALQAHLVQVVQGALGGWDLPRG